MWHRFDHHVGTVRDRSPSPDEATAEKDAVLETKAKKYPRQRVVDRNLVYVFRVQPG